MFDQVYLFVVKSVIDRLIKSSLYLVTLIDVCVFILVIVFD